jgi:hypothetical protein
MALPLEFLVFAPTWTANELGKRSSIERRCDRVFSLFSPFRIQRPPLCGWSAFVQYAALTYAITAVGLAAHQDGRPDRIRSLTRVLAHTWEGLLPCLSTCAWIGLHAHAALRMRLAHVVAQWHAPAVPVVDPLASAW